MLVCCSQFFLCGVTNTYRGGFGHPGLVLSLKECDERTDVIFFSFFVMKYCITILSVSMERLEFINRHVDNDCLATSNTKSS